MPVPVQTGDWLNRSFSRRSGNTDRGRAGRREGPAESVGLWYD